jgi:hypothetical protein
MLRRVLLLLTDKRDTSSQKGEAMATYIELHDLRNHPDVVRKTHVAIAAVAFDVIQPESPTTAARQTWAKAAIQDPAAVAPQIVHYVLVANLAATAAQIIAATDAAYKTNVVAALNKLVGPAA